MVYISNSQGPTLGKLVVTLTKVYNVTLFLKPENKAELGTKIFDVVEQLCLRINKTILWDYLYCRAPEALRIYRTAYKSKITQPMTPFAIPDNGATVLDVQLHFATFITSVDPNVIRIHANFLRKNNIDPTPYLDSQGYYYLKASNPKTALLFFNISAEISKTFNPGLAETQVAQVLQSFKNSYESSGKFEFPVANFIRYLDVV